MAKWGKATNDLLTALDKEFLAKKKLTENFYKEKISGKVFYISSHSGCDENDGSSQITAWKHCEMLKNAPISYGDTVLFECGSVFREQIDIVNGVTYSSYGIGEKPLFLGSIDASSADDWENIGNNLYRFRHHIDMHNDIGNVVFDGGEAWGIKIQKCDDCDMSLALRKVTNGLDFFEEIPSIPFKCGEELPNVNLAYFHSKEGYIYLCCKNGNPADVFSSIELSQSIKVFSRSKAEDITFSNLRFACVGCFAIRTVGCKNMTVRNCSFEFIGGAIQFLYENPSRNYRTRYGNAIENWGACDGMTVENCYFNQIYDAGITTQSNGKYDHEENLCYVNNVFDCNQYAFELWSGGPESRFTNICVKGNVCKNVGDGMTTQRPDKGHESFFNSRGDHPIRNCEVSYNIINGSVNSMMRCNLLHTNECDNGYFMDYNVYVNNLDNDFALISADYPAHTNGIKSVPFTQSTIDELSCEWFEMNGEFYYITE